MEGALPVLDTVTAPARHRTAVAALYLTTFMVILDVNVVITALPSLQTDLHTSPATVQWVIGAYTLCLATLSLSAGSLGDRYGRKRMYLAGVALFVGGSAACGVASSAVVLLSGRFVQGAGAAIALPATLSLLVQAFPEPAERGRMIAGSAIASGLAGVVGPAVGGLLIAAAGWQAIFLVNLPIGAVILWLGARSLTESADPEHASLDLPGQVLGIAWLGCLSLALIDVGSAGWSTTALVSLATAAVCLVVFIVVELRQAAPMLPLRWFGAARFAVPNVASFGLGFTAYTLITLFPSYLQGAQHRTPVGAAVLLLPASAAGVLAPYVAGRWLRRSGPAWPLATGYLLLVAACLMLFSEHPGTGFPETAVFGVLLGGGAALALPPTNAAVLEAVGRERSGTGSATVNATRQAGTTLGIAVLGSVVAAAPTQTIGLHRIAAVAGVIGLVVAVVVTATRRRAF